MASFDITRIAGNIGALNALNSLNRVNTELATHQSRLSSGKRINSAADDPAGLTIATKMNAQDQGLQTALSNIGDAQNLLSVAESGLSGINDILVQMRNKAQQGASDTMGSDERKALVSQMSAYAQQIDDAVGQTQWNGNALINGQFSTISGKSLTFQTGAYAADTTKLSGLDDMSASGINLNLATKSGTNLASAAPDNSSSALWGTVGTKTGPQTGTVGGGGELATGDYTISITYGTTTLAGDNSTVKLVDNQGNTLVSKTANLNANANVDFQNGLTVNLASLANAQTADNTIVTGKAYTTGVNYSASTSGATYSLNGLTGNSDASAFSNYLSQIDKAMTKVNDQLSNIGAMEGRLTYKSDQVANSQINVEGAYNRIMNADMASEQVQSSKLQILQQTATAMLAQANTAPQFILSLFK
jgi:flagellin